MAILKNIAILAMAFAALLVLSSAAPLRVQQRSRRQATEADLLGNVSIGLGVLHNLSVSIPINLCYKGHSYFLQAMAAQMHKMYSDPHIFHDNVLSYAGS
jgi:hypothetical protein